uniref:Secreted protein n=1 Tax=Panagrellus redivivus TaxID=6233 RepID=A0A7E4V117_PANRE
MTPDIPPGLLLLTPFWVCPRKDALHSFVRNCDMKNGTENVVLSFSSCFPGYAINQCPKALLVFSRDAANRQIDALPP